MKRTALTLLELVVVLAIIGILFALIFPAVQYARESSRRIKCASNLKQIIIGVHTYESNFKVFPPGSNAYGMSLHVSLLPYVEQANLHDLLSPAALTPSNPDSVWERPPELPNPAIYNCPSDYVDANLRRNKASSYAGNFGTGYQESGYNGAFRRLRTASQKWPGGPITPGMVSDGLSNTAFIAESLVANGSTNRRRFVFQTRNRFSRQGELRQFVEECRAGRYVTENGEPLGDPWMRGHPWLRGDAGFTLYNHVLGPNEPSCTNSSLVQHGAYSASSNHPDGVQVAYGDGRVVFVADNIDAAVWRAAGSRDGNDVPISAH